jgi:hypothetical protein
MIKEMLAFLSTGKIRRKLLGVRGFDGGQTSNR